MNRPATNPPTRRAARRAAAAAVVLALTAPAVTACSPVIADDVLRGIGRAIGICVVSGPCGPDND
jgi:cation transport ATPase